MTKFSYSKLDTFQTCPKKYEYKYLMKLATFQNEPMKYGTDLHQTISDSLLEKKADYTVFTMEKLEEAERLVDNALNYVGDRTLIGSEQKFGMDENFEETSYDTGVFRGIVDAIVYDPDEGIEVIDFKTNFADYPKTQLLFYALLLNANYKVVPNKLTFFSLRLNRAVSHTVTPKELEAYKTQLLNQKKIVETTKNYKPNPRESCSICSYLYLCPAAAVLQVPEISDAEQAMDLLKLGELHTAFASDCKKRAQQYVKETGEVIEDLEGARIFMPQTTQAVKITDMSKLMEKLQEEGYEPEKYKNIDTKLLRQIPDYRKKFESCITIQPRTSYKWCKINTSKGGESNASEDKSRKAA
mgnify:CR=1 FL=1